MADRIIYMGANWRFRVDDSANVAYIEFYDSEAAEWKAALTVDLTTISDINGISLASHASRHAYGAADAIGDNALRFSQIDKVFGTVETTVSVDAGTVSVIDKGIYYTRCGSNTSVEYSPDGGSTWYTLIAAGGIGLIISDGSNVRFNNAGTVAEDSYLLPIL